MTTQPASLKTSSPLMPNHIESIEFSVRRPRARGLISAVVLAAIVTGCGSSSPAAKTSSPTITAITPASSAADPTGSEAGDGSGADASACQLLSEGDVTAAMRQPMKLVGGAGSAVCEYAATADPSALLAVQTFATQQDAGLYTQAESSSEHLDGLGDDAFWNSTLDMVFVKTGQRGFSVTSPSLANLIGDPQASEAAMVTLAKIVLSKF